MTSGQAQALDQVREIEAVSDGSVILVASLTESEDDLALDLSIRTSEIRRLPGGIPLRARERFIIFVPKDFPFAKPKVLTRHKRFADRAHVQWSRQLCLYQAPDVEWNPGDGMYGFIERLWEWLVKGAIDQLDPVGGALHQPVTYTRSGPQYYVVPRIDTPPLENETWTGLGRLSVVNDHRVDIVEWSEPYSDEPLRSSAAVVLLSAPMPWEFPQKTVDLVRLLADRGVPKEKLFRILRAAVRENEEEDPLYVLIGTPMRGIRGSGDLRQHLTAWRVEPTFANGLRLIANKHSVDEVRREVGKEVEKIMLDWAEKAEISWCRVLEDRPEIVTRRDHSSPMSVFGGKSVAVWGCGALGAHVALHLARAGVTRIVLRDNDIVTPGVLIRQPYDDVDVGRFKVAVLAEKIRAIRSSDSAFEVEPLVSNVLSTALDSDDWTDGVDIVFDCTASRGVRVKLEKIRKDTSTDRANLVSMIVSRQATYGLCVVAAANHTGGVADVYRRAKIDVCRDPSLRHFADAFYPPPSNDDLFQPEPGCSSPTFIGSSTDAAALSALLLNAAASDLRAMARKTSDDTQRSPMAWAHYVVQPHVLAGEKRLVKSADFSYLPDIVTNDPRQGYEVRTSVDAWEQMESWVERSRDAVGPAVETGGLSFGERNDAMGVIWVTEVDGPPPDSIARPDLFQCGIVGTLQAHLSRERWSRGSVQYVGMWHTHPFSSPNPSTTDHGGMRQILSEGAVNPSKSLLSILGTPHSNPDLGTFVFGRSDVRQVHQGMYQGVRDDHEPSFHSRLRKPSYGLALSGGGSRAIAFHLGCLRALHDRGILEEVGVISGVSGGAVLAAMYAYSDDDFEEFETRVRALLHRGLQLDLVRAMLNPFYLIQTLASLLVAGVAAMSAQVVKSIVGVGHTLFRRDNRVEMPAYASRINPPFLRWASRTSVFENVLKDRIFGGAVVSHPKREDLEVVLNATELRTGTAFRFGSRASASSRFGLVQEDILVATAVAASAAYPIFLPALHKRYTFENEHPGQISSERVVLTDGGAYDNLGVSCLDPTRSSAHTAHVYACEHLVCCRAGHGQWGRSVVPYGWPSRMSRTVKAMFRKGQDRTVRHLINQSSSGDLESLVLPYLGMKDEALRRDTNVRQLPDNFVTRKQIIGYPTDFRAMGDRDYERLFRRGEQITHLLVEAYWNA